MVFAIHWHESAMDLHVFPIPIPPPTRFPTWSLWVFLVYQPGALDSCIQPGLVICFTLDNIHVSMLFSQNIPPLPSPTESKSLFCTSVSLSLFHANIFLNLFFSWRKITLQCILFCCTTPWVSHNYTYIPSAWVSPLPSPPPSRLLQRTSLGSWYYTATSHWLSILRMMVYKCQCCFLHSSHLLLPLMRDILKWSWVVKAEEMDFTHHPWFPHHSQGLQLRGLVFAPQDILLHKFSLVKAASPGGESKVSRPL